MILTMLHKMGKPELLEAISDYIQNTRDVHYDPQTEIIATVGATPKPSMQPYLQFLILEIKLWFLPRFSPYISH